MILLYYHNIKLYFIILSIIVSSGGSFLLFSRRLPPPWPSTVARPLRLSFLAVPGGLEPTLLHHSPVPVLRDHGLVPVLACYRPIAHPPPPQSDTPPSISMSPKLASSDTVFSILHLLCLIHEHGPTHKNQIQKSNTNEICKSYARWKTLRWDYNEKGQLAMCLVFCIRTYYALSLLRTSKETEAD